MPDFPSSESAADRARDEGFLRRTLDLARAGIGLTSPNPCVGAVIVDNQGSILGTGTHTYAGIKHAEVLAIEQAGARARGATLYVNLEPCSHQGRTGPCVEAIKQAGIGRVVACMQDPNPVVSGQGFAQLRNAGILVSTGILEPEAHTLNEAFARYIRHRVPLVTLKSAMTLDGKIASARERRTAAVEWITGEAARAHVQELRHQHDAILVGAGTVISDDPLLTDRSGRPRRRPLMRVILDSHLRLPLESKLVRSAAEDVLVLYSVAEEAKTEQLRKMGVRVEQIAAGDKQRPDLRAVLQRLGEMELTSLMIEGGAEINRAALAAGVVDKLFLYYAPLIFAGESSVPFAEGTGFAESRYPRLQSVKLQQFGQDLAVEGYLRDPYE